MTLQTFAHIDENTCPDQQKTKRKTKTMTMSNAFREYPKMAILKKM